LEQGRKSENSELILSLFKNNNSRFWRLFIASWIISISCSYKTQFSIWI